MGRGAGSAATGPEVHSKGWGTVPLRDSGDAEAQPLLPQKGDGYDWVAGKGSEASEVGGAGKPSSTGVNHGSSRLTVLYVVLWYCANIGILLLNKFLLSNYGFKYPFSLTMLHMLGCSVFSVIAVRLFRVVPLQTISSRSQLVKVVSLSAIFILSVVCGNLSLRFLPVSFNQAIGATTPLFTAALSFLLMAKRESLATYAALLPVVVGIVVASRAEPLFHLVGFLTCIVSTAARALKSVSQAILLSSESEKLHSLNLLMYMAPISFMLLLPIASLVEGNILEIVFQKATDSPWMLPLLLLNMCAAYFANLLNFLVTKHTSPLTLQVLGNAKAVIAVAVSVLLFQNPVTFVGQFGFALTILGVVLYGEFKRQSSRKV